MAFSKYNSVYLGDDPLPHCEYVLDSAADVADLPTDTAPGSVAIVAAAGGAVYILNASHEWKEM